MGATAFQLMRRRQAEERLTAEAENLPNESPEGHEAAEEFAAAGVSVNPVVEDEDEDRDAAEAEAAGIVTEVPAEAPMGDHSDSDPLTLPVPAPQRPKRVRNRRPRTINP